MESILWCLRALVRARDCGIHPAAGLISTNRFWKAPKREAKEECGYDVELTGFLALSALHVVGKRWESDETRHAIGIYFSAQALGEPGEYGQEEIADIRWFTKEEIIQLGDKLRCHDIPKIIENFEQNKIYPLDVIVETKQ